MRLGLQINTVCFIEINITETSQRLILAMDVKVGGRERKEKKRMVVI